MKMKKLLIALGIAGIAYSIYRWYAKPTIDAAHDQFDSVPDLLEPDDTSIDVGELRSLINREFSTEAERNKAWAIWEFTSATMLDLLEQLGPIATLEILVEGVEQLPDEEVAALTTYMDVAAPQPVRNQADLAHLLSDINDEIDWDEAIRKTEMP